LNEKLLRLFLLYQRNPENENSSWKSREQCFFLKLVLFLTNYPPF
jgi:hypothetical protein